MTARGCFSLSPSRPRPGSPSRPDTARGRPCQGQRANPTGPASRQSPYEFIRNHFREKLTVIHKWRAIIRERVIYQLTTNSFFPFIREPRVFIAWIVSLVSLDSVSSTYSKYVLFNFSIYIVLAICFSVFDLSFKHCLIWLVARQLENQISALTLCLPNCSAVLSESTVWHWWRVTK